VNIKKLVIALGLAVIIALSIASPVLAESGLPYNTPIVIGEGLAVQTIGEMTITTGGTVIIRIDEAGTYWRLANIKFYIGDEPPSKIKPDKYPFQHDGLGGPASDSFSIDLEAIDLNGDGIVYVALYADLVGQTALSKGGKQLTTGESAWAQGDQSSGKAKNYRTFFSVYRWTIG
jgi:hypothetical protein